MKYFVSALASALVVTLPLPALAGYRNFEKRFAGREDVSHDEIVRTMYSPELLDEPLDTDSLPSGLPPNLNEMYAALFEPAAVKMPFRVIQEKNAEQTILCSGTIYYSQGDLFLQQDVSTKCAWPLPNLATLDGALYTWDSGTSEGEILTRFTGDTVELVEYLINPTLIKTSFYYQYQEAPEKFTVTEFDGVMTLRANDLEYGFGGILITRDPLWLKGFVMYECDTQACFDTAMENDFSVPEDFPIRNVMEIDAPIPLAEIPDEVKVLPEGVTFNPSGQTADRFMTYL